MRSVDLTQEFVQVTFIAEVAEDGPKHGLGVFSALDAMLFYVYFEAMLIPMFLAISRTGFRASAIRYLSIFLSIPSILKELLRDFIKSQAICKAKDSKPL